MASERAPELSEVIRRHVEAGLLDLRVAMPARIVAFDAGQQRADCKPLIKIAHLDEADQRLVESVPVIPGVPVSFAGGGGHRATYPVHADAQDGDTCLLVFSDQSLDRWLAGTGAEVDPEIDHGHALPDAVAVLGLRPFGAPLGDCPTDRSTFGRDSNVQLQVTSAQVKIVSPAGYSSDQALVLGTVFRAKQQALHTVAIAQLTAAAGDPGLAMFAPLAAAALTALAAAFQQYETDAAGAQNLLSTVGTTQ